jgi:hypothetical protein
LLADRLAEGPLPLAAALEYAAALANALGEFHREGRAHGDVVPGALCVSERGAILLPPPLDRRTHAATPREDVSATGAVLREMLAGSVSAGGRIHQAASKLAAECLNQGDTPTDLHRLAVRLRVLRVMAQLHEERRTAASRRAEPEIGPTAAVPPAEPGPSPSARVAPLLAPRNPAGALQLDERCPRCRGQVFPSSPHGLFDWFLALLCIRVRRCHSCYYRYFRVLGLPVVRED